MQRRYGQSDSPTQRHAKRIRTAGYTPQIDGDVDDAPVPGCAPAGNHQAAYSSLTSTPRSTRSPEMIQATPEDGSTEGGGGDDGHEAPMILQGRRRRNSDPRTTGVDRYDTATPSSAILGSPRHPEGRQEGAGEDTLDEVYDQFIDEANEFFTFWQSKCDKSGYTEAEFRDILKNLLQDLIRHSARSPSAAAGDDKLRSEEIAEEEIEQEQAGQGDRYSSADSGHAGEGAQPTQDRSHQTTLLRQGAPPAAGAAGTQPKQGRGRPKDVASTLPAAAPSPTPTEALEEPTLVESLTMRIREQRYGGDSSLDNDDLARLAAARRVDNRDFLGRLSSKEICVLGTAVLDDIFGRKGQRRLSELFVELYSNQPNPQLKQALHTISGPVAEKIRREGCAELSDFTKQWAHAVQSDYYVLGTSRHRHLVHGYKFKDLLFLSSDFSGYITSLQYKRF